MVLADLEAMRTGLARRFEELPPPAEAPWQWERLWTGYPRQWLQCVRLFGDKARSIELSGLEAAPGEVPPPPEAPEAPGAVQCDYCPRVFSTAAKAHSHMVRAHGLRDDYRNFIETSTCPVCLADFRTRFRALDHVKRRSIRCRLHIDLGGVPCLPEARVRVLDREMASFRADCKRRGVQPNSRLPMRRPGAHPG